MHVKPNPLWISQPAPGSWSLYHSSPSLSFYSRSPRSSTVDNFRFLHLRTFSNFIIRHGRTFLHLVYSMPSDLWSYCPSHPKLAPRIYWIEPWGIACRRPGFIDRGCSQSWSSRHRTCRLRWFDRRSPGSWIDRRAPACRLTRDAIRLSCSWRLRRQQPTAQERHRSTQD